MKKIYVIAALCLGNQIFSQISTNVIKVKSPESYSYEKAGNIPVNKFSGTLDLSIPLFNINVGTESVKAELKYDSSGFQPIKKSGFAGLNWSLNYSGVITREVNGIPDDYQSSNSEIKGFLKTIQRNSSNINDYNTNYSGNNFPPNINGNFVEIDSDKYQFNFWGISGFFYIGNNGYPIVQSNDPNLTVDISNYAQQFPLEQNDCKLQRSEFTIIDGKGNKYFFGGDYNNLEINSSLGGSEGAAANNLPDLTIMGWYLYKVELNDGKKIIYTYNDDTYGVGIEHSYCKLKNTLPYKQDMNEVTFSFEIHKYINQSNKGRETSYTGSVGGYSISGKDISSRWQAPYFMYSALKKVKLKKINVIDKINTNGTYDNNYSVDFNYTSSIDNYGYRYDYLSDIQVKNRYQTVQNIELTISPKGSDQKRWLLTRVKNNADIYDLEYYNDEYFPSETTFGIDLWGFWNGKAENNTLIPQYTFSKNTGDVTITGTSRDASYNHALTGILKKITYPTKGTTEFFYEPHDYSYKVVRNSSTNFLPKRMNITGESSGIRIVKMIDTPITGNPFIREYKYKNDRENINSGSSGTQISLYEFFKYLGYTRKLNNSIENITEVTEYATNLSQNIFSYLNVEYSKVQEYLNGKLQKEYSFTNYLDFPNYVDEIYSNISLLQTSVQQDSNFFLGDYQKNLSAFAIDNGYKRGRIKNEAFFNDNGLIREIDTEYTTLPYHSYCKNMIKNGSMQYLCGLNTETDYATRVTTIGTSWIQKGRIFITPFVIDRTTDSRYFDNGNKYHNTIYGYNDSNNLNLTDTQEYDVDELVTKTKYTYPQNSVNSHLVSKNFLSQALTVEKSQDVFTSNGLVNYPISKSETKYDNSSQLFPTSVLSQNIQTGIMSTELTYDQYDNKGNILQYTEKGLKPTTIVWGYNQSQPIAKIEGAKISDIPQSLINIIVSAADTDAQQGTEGSEQALLAALDNFRNSSDLSGYQITTYSYNPLIGVTSITPPSGIREVYIYDTANRLKEIRKDSASGNLLKTFKYNYKN